MAENNKKQNTSAADNTQKPEKKMTRYDMKMQRRREEELRQQKKKKQAKLAVVVVILICIVAVGYNFYAKYQERHGEYVAIGDHSIDKAEYDYYFYSSLNSFTSTYGSYISLFGLDLTQSLDSQSYSDTMTWQDYFDQQAVEQLKMVYALTDEASANGFEYDATDDYNTFVDSIHSYASSQDMKDDEYCQSIFGTYASVKTLEPFVKQSSTATAYYNSIEEATEVTDDEINTYYDENKDSYDSVDYRICKISADMPEEETTDAAETEETEELSEEEQAAIEAAQQEAEDAAMAEAKAKADEMLANISDEDSFVEQYQTYADDVTTDSLNTNVKKSSISPTAVSEWLFDSERQAGDTTVIEYEAGDAYYVVYFIDRYLDHQKTVDVRHILISADTTEDTDSDEDTEAEEAANAAAKAKAEEIYEEWKNGEATEDSFAALAETYSTDTGSNTNGGLYEAVEEGDMLENFNNWIFDENRQPGDTDIIETSYGYHIVYFVGDNAEEWHVSIEDTLRSSKMDDYMTALTENLEVVDKKGHIAYLNVAETETETVIESGTETATESETETATETE